MTYKDNFVAVVKCNGAIMREQDGAVKLPFGSEYNILLKNLDNRRAQVKITIDGENVLDGNALVVDGNISTELEGFMNGSVAKNRFKFIKKTQKIVEHRGDRIEDGLIRIEYQFEKRPPLVIDHEHHHHHYDDWHLCSWYPYPYYPPYSPPRIIWKYGDYQTTAGLSNVSVTCTTNAVTVNGSPVASYNCNSEPQINADEGITVHGSQVNQQFTSVNIGELESNSYVIIIKLIGTDSKGVKISKPITVKTKLECPSCGTKSKSSIKYCGECGTYLI